MTLHAGHTSLDSKHKLATVGHGTAVAPKADQTMLKTVREARQIWVLWVDIDGTLGRADSPIETAFELIHGLVPFLGSIKDRRSQVPSALGAGLPRTAAL